MRVLYVFVSTLHDAATVADAVALISGPNGFLSL